MRQLNSLRKLAAALILCASTAPYVHADGSDLDIQSGNCYVITNYQYPTYCMGVSGTSLIKTTTDTANPTPYLFKFIRQDDGTWHIQHVQTSQYVKSTSKGYGGAAKLSSDESEAGSYTIADATHDGYYTLAYNPTESEDYDKTYVYMHMASDHNLIVGWEASAEASQWSFTLAAREITVNYRDANTQTTLLSTTQTVLLGETIGSTEVTATSDATVTVDVTAEECRFLSYNGLIQTEPKQDFIYADGSSLKQKVQTAGATDVELSDNTLFKIFTLPDGTCAIYSVGAAKFVDPIVASTATTLGTTMGIFTKTYDATRQAYYIGNATATSTSDKLYLNALGGPTNNNSVGGYSVDDGSCWFIIPNDNTVDAVKNYVNHFGDTRSLTMINNTVDKMYSNMPATNDGQGLAGLIDGNTSTYYHSSYATGYANTVHNLIIRLNEGNTSTAFTVKYVRRQDNYYANPTDIKVYGSKDSDTDLGEISDWEEVTELTTDDGLGQDAGTFSFDTKGQQYAALRFDVIESYEKYNTTIRTNTYFNYSIFELYDLANADLLGAYDTVNAIDLATNSAADVDNAYATFDNVSLVNSLQQDNTERYTISNVDSARGTLIYDPTKEDNYIYVADTADNTNANHIWSLIHHNGETYLYNHGAKLYANAYGDRNTLNSDGNESDAAAEHHSFTWHLTDVPTPVEITKYADADQAEAVCIIGGVNSIDGKEPGMSAFTDRQHPVVVCNGASSATDGNGWIFTKVDEAAAGDDIDAVIETKATNEESANQAYEEAVAYTDGDENIVGNFTIASQQAIRNFCNENGGADAIEHAITLGERVGLTDGKVYTFKTADGKYWGINASDEVEAMDYDNAKASYFLWMCEQAEGSESYKFYHEINNGTPSTPAAAPAMRRAAATDDVEKVYLTIDDTDTFSDITYPAMGQTQLTSNGSTLVITGTEETSVETITEISEILADDADATAPAYDLLGRRILDANRHGLRISNGRLLLR